MIVAVQPAQTGEDAVAQTMRVVRKQSRPLSVANALPGFRQVQPPVLVQWTVEDAENIRPGAI